MNLNDFKRKREVFEHEVDGAVFSLLPLPADLIQVFNTYLFGGGREFMSLVQRSRFLDECVTGWVGIEGDDGKDFEYSKANKSTFLSDDYQDLMFELVSASFMHKNKQLEALKENIENAKK